MAAHRRHHHVIGWSKLTAPAAPAALAVALFAWPAAQAQAQVVQDCQPAQFLDRTAAAADRALTWDFSIISDPERCLQVRTGQTVVWTGDFATHPLAGQGGDSPNPIVFHNNGSVTFNSAGTFGFVCLSHSSMKGAIKVVQAPAAPAPALPGGPAAALAVLLLASGLMLASSRRRVRVGR